MDSFNVERFATLKTTTHAEHLSDRYKVVPTMDVIEVLQDYGWQPVSVKQARVQSTDNQGYQKHIVRLENPEFAVVGQSETYAPQILLTNSHNGTATFNLQMGVFRLVCMNGMVVGDTYAKQKIRHVGFATAKVEQAAKVMAESAPRIINAVQKMQDITLDPSQYSWLAMEAVDARFPELTDSHKILHNVRQIGLPNRRADEGNDLWRSFNRIQENAIRGHRCARFYTSDDSKTPRRLPPVTNIGRDLKLNAQLWDLAEQFVN
jgi:hypothetical protein